MGQLLTFEKPEDAGHFARLLQGNGFNVVGSAGSVSLDAQPLMWDTRRIEQFCRGSDFEVALVPSGEKLTPPENNVYDPARFGDGPAPPEEGFQSRTMMGQSMWNPAGHFDQRQRAQNIMRKTNMTNNQKRAQSVWDAAMRRAHGNFGQEMCGNEECGLDKHLGDRDLFEKLYGAGPSGPGPEGPSGPGPRGPGPWGPGPMGPGPWTNGPDGLPGWSH